MVVVFISYVCVQKQKIICKKYFQVNVDFCCDVDSGCEKNVDYCVKYQQNNKYEVRKVKYGLKILMGKFLYFFCKKIGKSYNQDFIVIRWMGIVKI